MSIVKNGIVFLFCRFIEYNFANLLQSIKFILKVIRLKIIKFIENGQFVWQYSKFYVIIYTILN